MDMQDKELDNLFRSKLEDFEFEPSANVWQGIDADLNTGKRKKAILLPLLSAAASIIVLVTAGVWLGMHKTRVTNTKADRVAINKIDNPVKQVIAKQQPNVVYVAQPKPVVSNVKQNTAPQMVKNYAPVSQWRDTITGKQQAAQPTTQKLVADVQEKFPIQTPANKIDTTVVAVKEIIPQTAVSPVAIATNIPQPGKPAAKATKKHHIHSLGDMLNTVIAAVDKRKDKLIEFSDTDDDESTITGVNLGIIAVKKQN